MEWDAPVLEARDLARTYDGGAYSDSWAAVLDFQAVLRYANTHPNKGSHAISSALEIPRGRVRSWVGYDSKPDAVHGIEVAREYGWLEATPRDDTFQALNALVANVFSGGSISTRSFAPSFALNHREHRSHVLETIDATGIDYEFAHEDDDSRATEVRPTADGTVLGRTLVALGAPVGPKAELERLSLPWYLDEAPFEVREMFVLAYLANRGIHHAGKDTIQIREERPQRYRDELASFIEDIAKEPVTSTEHGITISADAARSLGLQPRYRNPKTSFE
ncbi:hypothetical protein [Natronolimnohabitans innermongolicus]|uniref:Uncharacterized protein n=1 Tax=Natronolimnohabitans innermongolicus JCM 12255 TaxID=1227499 RepID=L9WSM9_9EURY|nr:hypothetical protein [Natronolimnohabitans innermongolicus]ELY52479.1 hypothetical protein C493_15560 [Natronolimnohabitans innermongolicus JCM 12255]